jgi:hypothetical protein
LSENLDNLTGLWIYVDPLPCTVARLPPSRPLSSNVAVFKSQMAVKVTVIGFSGQNGCNIALKTNIQEQLDTINVEISGRRYF